MANIGDSENVKNTLVFVLCVFVLYMHDLSSSIEDLCAASLGYLPDPELW